jgi:hypothetical protein
MKRALISGLLLVTLALSLSACGGASNDISANARDQLAPMVAEVRRLASSYDPYGALLALGRLRDTVVTLHNRGELGDDRAVAIFSAARDVERKLASAPTTTTTTTSTTLPPVPAPAKNEHGKGDEAGKDKGGKGHG